ncbi:MAG: transcriptional regulator [Patescibacteria group bacterium]|nr:transcriptional regulator [Patescibacteria group bacterium]
MTTIIKVLKTKEDYNAALELTEELINKDPDPNSEDGEKLNLLATLVQDYESKEFPESLPDPIDAIKFRMEQQNLKPKDLVPYIGSRSKVSEVLSRKRPLTIDMIRAIEKGLGIPAKVLLKETDEFRNTDNVAWSRFPLK